MPAALPGSTNVENLANPSAGKFVIFDPLSGPKGSPLDVRKIVFAAGNGTPTYTNDAANQQPSTGAMSTGIGIGANRIIGPASTLLTPAAYGIFNAGYDDDGVPGQAHTYAAPPPPGNVSANTVNSTRMYIGGGRSVTSGAPLYLPVAGQAGATPYTAGVSILGAGNGGSRDAGAGPAFTGFELKMVTAVGAVANGAAIEGTWVNRSGVAMVAVQSAFGSSNVASAAPA